MNGEERGGEKWGGWSHSLIFYFSQWNRATNKQQAKRNKCTSFHQLNSLVTIPPLMRVSERVGVINKTSSSFQIHDPEIDTNELVWCLGCMVFAFILTEPFVGETSCRLDSKGMIIIYFSGVRIYLLVCRSLGRSLSILNWLILCEVVWLSARKCLAVIHVLFVFSALILNITLTFVIQTC